MKKVMSCGHIRSGVARSSDMSGIIACLLACVLLIADTLSHLRVGFDTTVDINRSSNDAAFVERRSLYVDEVESEAEVVTMRQCTARHNAPDTHTPQKATAARGFSERRWAEAALATIFMLPPPRPFDRPN